MTGVQLITGVYTNNFISIKKEMPTSYSFQLNLDFSIRKSDPHFGADNPEFSEIFVSSNFADNCLPSKAPSIIQCFKQLENGSIDFVSEDCRIRSSFNPKNFLPVQINATYQRSLNGSTDYYQCFITIADNEGRDDIPEIINSIFKHIPQSFCYLGLNGRVLRVNKRLRDFLKIPDSILLQYNYIDFIQSGDVEEAERVFMEATNGNANQFEFSVVLHNGTTKRVRVHIFPRFKNREVVGVFAIFDDITETVETKQRWQELVKQNPLPIIILVQKIIVFANSAALKFYGFENQLELIGKHLFDFVPEIDHEVINKREKFLIENGEITPRESILLSKDGKTKHVVAHAHRINYEGKTAIQSVLYDITDIKKQKEIIEKSLREKETLLKEIHHRVKNNLAIISGLIELQIQNIKDKGTIDVLRDSQNRIQSIALVHQQLYQVESLDEINLAVYLKNLVDGLVSTFEGDKEVKIEIDAEDILLNIEHAIPCSLIINEVVVNAFKHAFSGVNDPSVDIRIKRNSEDIHIIVCDNGVGLKVAPHPSNTPSLGTTLIDILSQQLEGKSGYEENHTPGTCFRLSFPIRQN